MHTDTSEKGLETIIERHLTEQCGYSQCYSADYDRDLCVNKKLLFQFIQQTQPTAYDTIVKRGKEKFLKRLAVQIYTCGY